VLCRSHKHLETRILIITKFPSQTNEVAFSHLGHNMIN